MAMAFTHYVSIICFSLCLLIRGTSQAQTSQTQVLLQLKRHLEFPQQLDVWEESATDLCYSPSSPSLSITCQGNSVTELKIVGNRTVKGSDMTFRGSAIEGRTLSQGFSIDSFVTTLSRLTTLKVVSLIALGMWGSLPDKIHRLYSLEVLDLSSNFLCGSIPPKISAMTKLQSLTLDVNFFNGTVPDWLDSLPDLAVLSLKNNNLTGPLPDSIGRIKNLTSLAIPHNQVSGTLPDLSELKKLEVLDMRENALNSGLPPMPQRLVTVLLSRNSLSGEIPQDVGKLVQLQHLDLSFNLLEGTPPSSLFSLPNISYLNLASNMLTGSLPNTLKCGGQLGFVDISSNKLKGGLPACLSSSQNNRVVKFSGNCLSIGTFGQHQGSYCEEANESIKQEHKNLGLLIGVVVGVVVLLLLIVLGYLANSSGYCSRKAPAKLLKSNFPPSSPTGFSSEIIANARYISNVKLGAADSPYYRLFTLDELEAATNSFDKSSHLGTDSAGELYKGRLENGIYVIIRWLSILRRLSVQNASLRLDLLSKLRHPHLVCLLGHCIEASQDDSVTRILLVYEYVANESLRSHLSAHSPDGPLKWGERLGILMGVAKALHYLHTGVIPGFLNNQLKSNNVLIDEHRIPKLSDYGLNIFTDEIDRIEAKTEGHKAYASENKINSKEEVKSEDDVYRFGLILLEALVGDEGSLKEENLLSQMKTSFSSQDGHHQIIDPFIISTSNQESLSIVISITNKCLLPDPSIRPSVEDILWNLQYAAQLQAGTDGEQKSD